jgi:hypothetical protein
MTSDGGNERRIAISTKGQERELLVDDVDDDASVVMGFVDGEWSMFAK